MKVTKSEPKYLHVVFKGPSGMCFIGRFNGLANDIPIYEIVEFNADEMGFPLSKAADVAQRLNKDWKGK